MIPQRRIYDPSCSIVYGTWNVEQRARLNDRQAGRKSAGDAQESGEGGLEDDDDDQLFRIAFLFRLAVLLVSFANVFSPEDAVFQKAPQRREILDKKDRARRFLFGSAFFCVASRLARWG